MHADTTWRTDNAPSTGAPLFWVGLKVANQDHLPERIAAHLPNGWVSEVSRSAAEASADFMPFASSASSCPPTATFCYVTAEVPVPGAGGYQASGQGQIVAMGTCDTSENNCKTTMDATEKMDGIDRFPLFYIHFKACPAGLRPKGIFMPTRFQLPNPTQMKHWEGYHIQSLRAVGHCAATLDESGNQSCEFSVVASVCHGKYDCAFRNIFQSTGEKPAVAGGYLVICAPVRGGEHASP